MVAVRRIVIGVHGSPGGELAERRYPSPRLRKIWREGAWLRLWTAFDQGLMESVGPKPWPRRRNVTVPDQDNYS